ncbi:hypothetical protein [uncultured Endozoicomonas sp.]|uniref:hypothetical protein n=1 Tax=uncultured Endozoicomonas sp. TaxID=432652 RepID=UPI002605F237|nr:hypothetical protein [uncultured Endozoicomonas sp.]
MTRLAKNAEIFQKNRIQLLNLGKKIEEFVVEIANNQVSAANIMGRAAMHSSKARYY